MTEIKRPRLKEKYEKEIISQLITEYKYKNVMQVPKLQKITINMGIGSATSNPKDLETAVRDLTRISGQKPVITKAKKSIASFKVREGNAIGCKITLRGARMYEFLDRLLNIAIPRTKDFRGISKKGFDGSGNYTLGLREQTIFPEVDLEDSQVIKGMNITFTINSKNDADSYSLLEKFGFPFKK
ncbi:MAG: 50S ribosomal protein L5 [Actinobacteria bacterium]|nr:50S ribosomal protein L5 [Actinomycetota bacterium]MCL6087285.1 50S ribosomal protein L5 [Actinomycetota bacterium]